VAFLVSDLAKQTITSEARNILVLECLGLVESSKVVIMTPKPIAELKFGLGIMP
jgi:hypothetical protein